jgi:uncharacterized membrane protein
MTNTGRVISIAVGVAILSGISLGVAYGSQQTIAESFRIVFGSVILLFVPGYIWSFVFFPNRQEKQTEGRGLALDSIERILLALALSMVLTPLALFLLNLVGIKITLLAIIGTITGLILLGGLALYWQKRKA